MGAEPERGWAGAEDFFRAVGDGPYADLPDGVTITFDLHGDGGGVFTIRRTEKAVELLRIEATRPDCRLRCSVQDFLDLVDGHLDSRRGFLEGRFEVEGDVGLVLRLERALTRVTPE